MPFPSLFHRQVSLSPSFYQPNVSPAFPFSWCPDTQVQGVGTRGEHGFPELPWCVGPWGVTTQREQPGLTGEERSWCLTTASAMATIAITTRLQNKAPNLQAPNLTYISQAPPPCQHCAMHLTSIDTDLAVPFYRWDPASTVWTRPWEILLEPSSCSQEGLHSPFQLLAGAGLLSFYFLCPFLCLCRCGGKGGWEEFWPDGRLINDSDLIICCSSLN